MGIDMIKMYGIYPRKKTTLQSECFLPRLDKCICPFLQMMIILLLKCINLRWAFILKVNYVKKNSSAEYSSINAVYACLYYLFKDKKLFS